MHIQSLFLNLLTSTSLLLTSTHAQPQTDIDSLAIELISYLGDLATDSAYISAVIAVTAASDISVLTSWAGSVSSVLANLETFSSDYLDPLPTEVRSVYGSVVQAQISIATRQGFDFPPAPTLTDYGSGRNSAPGVTAGPTGPRETGFVTVTRDPSAENTGSGGGGSNNGGGDDGGLSTGAKAGIGAGIGLLALIAIAAIAFCLLRKRSKKKKENEARMSSAAVNAGVVGGAYNNTNNQQQQPQEKYSEPVNQPEMTGAYHQEHQQQKFGHGQPTQYQQPGQYNQPQGYPPPAHDQQYQQMQHSTSPAPPSPVSQQTASPPPQFQQPAYQQEQNYSQPPPGPPPQHFSPPPGPPPQHFSPPPGPPPHPQQQGPGRYELQ